MVTNKLGFGVEVDNAAAITKIKGVGGAFKTLSSTAKTESDRVGSHFDGAGDRIARRFQRKDIKTLGSSISNSITALATGGSVAEVVGAAGLLMGVSLATQFVIGAAERIAGSAAVQALAAALAPIGAALVAAASGIGTTIGTVIPTLAAVALAIWPAILVAAIVAGIVFLIHNPEIVRKIGAFASDMLASLGRGLAKLGELLGGIFGRAFNLVRGIIAKIVGKIVDVIMGIINAVKNALEWLGKLKPAIGNAMGGNPNFDALKDAIGQHASGGWVGLHGPELGILGEKGPEFVSPAGSAARAAAGGGGVTIEGVSARDLADIIDRELYVRLRRAAPTGGRI